MKSASGLDTSSMPFPRSPALWEMTCAKLGTGVLGLGIQKFRRQGLCESKVDPVPVGDIIKYDRKSLVKRALLLTCSALETNLRLQHGFGVGDPLTFGEIGCSTEAGKPSSLHQPPMRFRGSTA